MAVLFEPPAGDPGGFPGPPGAKKPSIGGALKAAILCMIAANGLRGIASSAIWNVTWRP